VQLTFRFFFVQMLGDGLSTYMFSPTYIFLLTALALWEIPFCSIVSFHSFGIAASDRLSGKTSVSVIISFSQSAFILSGRILTLVYPSNFFASSVTPTVASGASSVTDLTATCGATSATAVVITLSGATIAPSAAVTITISGFTMGPPTKGSGGLRLRTGFCSPSNALSSGSILSQGQVSSLVFSIASSDRIAGKSSVDVTLTFMSSTPIPSGDTVTFIYPSLFFTSSVTPTATSSLTNLGISCGATNTTFVVFTTSGTTISSFSPLTVTIHGLTMGAAFHGSVGISVKSSSESASYAIPSGPILSSFKPPPITTGLIGHYNADSWADSIWFDLSGLGNHVIEIGGESSIAVSRPVGAPAYVFGANTAWMIFPDGILPSPNYTLFYVARYNGPSKGRIFQGVHSNWLSGFDLSLNGFDFSSCGLKTQDSQDLHGYDWVIASDRRNSFRSNGKERALSDQNKCPRFDRLAVNTGFYGNMASDFAIQTILVYNVQLSTSDVQLTEAWLSAQQPEFSPSNLQACSPCFFSASHIYFLIVRELRICM
jgi:hypothetical protein